MEKMNHKQLRDHILENVPSKYRSTVISAMDLSKNVHQGQKRLSGEDYYLHPLNVAAIVSEMGMDAVSIVVALLHNTLNSKDPLLNQDVSLRIQKEFGSEILSMVTALQGFSLATRSRSDQETITRFLLRSSRDLRLIMIKLADRLHNARTIESLSEKKQKIAAQNMMGIYGPLCTYLNLYKIKKELEEIAFKILKPVEYEHIDKVMKDRKEVDEVRLEKIMGHLDKLAKKSVGKDVKVYGRIKGHYSIYRKLKNKEAYTDKNTIDNILDLLAFTVIVPTAEDCYILTEKLIKTSHVDMRHYEDYIKQPKENGYRSIHLIIMPNGVSDRTYEIQIKTAEMHHYNIYGPASHLGYKGVYGSKKTSYEFYWVKDIHKKMYEFQTTRKDSFSIPIHSDLFDNKIFVFTPSNELIEMPIGSTVIDLAYRLHSDIGNKTSDVMINSKRTPLSQMLQNGDRVEIIRDPDKKLPDREWLEFVRTRRAREAIESEFRKQLLNDDPYFTPTL